jgi:predicted nuclease with TOPRIM domain
MSIDIVNLIESNPITKFSGDYQSKLIEKVKKSFTNYEQQLFLSSFYCYLKYDSKNDFVIDLDNVWKWLDFGQKDSGKRVIEKNFLINKDYKIFAPQVGGAKKDNRGGHNKEIIMLNIDTFKRFCLKAGTKKADEVHDYFIKLENIMFEITKEECEELKQQVMQLENKNKETQETLFKEKEIQNEKTLLEKFSHKCSLIYIIKVKTFENGEYIIKIGYSNKGITYRYNEHKTNYDECILLNCFLVDKSKDFEGFLHNHNLVYPNKCKTLEKHEKENELFLIGTTLTYQMLLKIIEDNINNYNYRVSELLLENQLLKEKLNSNQNNIQEINNDEVSELKQMIKQLSNEIFDLKKSNQQILNNLNAQETKVVTGFNQQMPHLGPRLQKINPETLQLVKVYESVTEAMNEDKNLKRPSISKAVEENTIYCGFRWLLVERNVDPNIIHSIQPTKQTKVQNLGYIAKLNADKSEILNVYLDRKTAAELNGYPNSSALDNPVKNNTITNGNYYTLYDKCEQNLIQNFEEKYSEPKLYKNGVGQYDLNNNLVKEFGCKYDCIRELKMSDKTLHKSLQNNIPYNNYYYKEIGAKLSVQ